MAQADAAPPPIGANKWRHLGLGAFLRRPKNFSASGAFAATCGVSRKHVGRSCFRLICRKVCDAAISGLHRPGLELQVSNYQIRENSGEYGLTCPQRRF